MNMRFPSSWEGILDVAPADIPSSAGAHPSGSCDAWGSRIETTLLADLSEEERRGLAEHVQSCSACAERFRRYQVIEEFARDLPRYDLLGRRYVGLSSKGNVNARELHRQTLRKRMLRKRSRGMFVGLVLILCFTVFILAAVRQSMALLIAWLGIVAVVLVIPIVYEQLR